MGKYAVVSASGDTLVQRLELIKKYALEAKANGCSAVAFPECFLTGYELKNAHNTALSEDDNAIKTVSYFSETIGIDILFGFTECKDNCLYISYYISLRTGESHIYRKTHLGIREAMVFEAGNELPVFTLSDGAKVGVQLCVETHYPEITQTLSLRGADIIFAPHAIPAIAGNRKEIWEKYIPARAYDNRVTVACCNMCDSGKFAGGCFVVSPKGETVASDFSGKPAMVVFETYSNNEKSKYYFPARRRKELYI